jgi:hypothetical protein
LRKGRKKINVGRLGIKHEKEDQNPFTFKSSKALSNTQIYSFFFYLLFFSYTCSFLLTCRSIDKSTFLIEKDGLRQGGRMNTDKCMNNSRKGFEEIVSYSQLRNASALNQTRRVECQI